MFNISEGFLRRRDKETAQFLRYAFASNGELKSGYHACEGRQSIAVAEHIALNESIAKMLRRWQGTLDTSGPRTKDDQGQRTDQGPDKGRTKNQGPRTRDSG